MGKTSQERLRIWQKKKARSTNLSHAFVMVQYDDVQDCTMQRKITGKHNGTSIEKLAECLERRRKVNEK